MPVNQSGSSPREPEFVEGTGGCTRVGGAPVGEIPAGGGAIAGEPFIFMLTDGRSRILGCGGIAEACWAACVSCIIVICSGGKAWVVFPCCSGTGCAGLGTSVGT